GFSETMLNSGSTLLTDVQVAIENFPELLRMASEIDLNYKDVVNSYKTEFPVIFKVEAKTLETAYLEWKNIGNSSNKLEKAQQIFSSIKAMQFNFPMLKEQSVKIEDAYTKLVDFYKKTFPTVYEAEVVTLPIDAYRATDNSTKKLEEGMVLLDKADRLGQFYKVHLDQKALITDQMVRFTENYKKQFPVVYKFENERLTALKTTYELVGHSESKIEKANLLLSEAESVNSHKAELVSQAAEIALKFADFESKFKKNKPNAVLYKKAKMMYNTRFKEFADEGSAKAKVEKGRKLLGAMAVVLNKYTTDNTMLCKTLKEVKTANEVEALLGIR
ncbi:MAG TPA: hypothetical protein DCQ31_15560, partial [Bacteroidales bacterium]|nr:hypothetical protein [Bacteroidales bacterium]